MNKLLLSMLCCLSVACGGGGGNEGSASPMPSDARSLSASLSSGGRERTYAAYVPAKIDASSPLPLLIALHGGGGSGAGTRSLTGFDAVADANGFVVAYPDGYSNSWADGRGTTDADEAGVDDVAFIAALIDDAAARTPVDTRRVYVTGISNGGMMTLRLACQLSDKLAAAAPVAANMPTSVAAGCAAAVAVPVMHVHGDQDALMPRAGGALGPRSGSGSVLSTADSVAFWNGRNGCASTPTETRLIDTVADQTSIALSRYSACSGGAENRFYDVIGGGHTWPGGVQYLPVATIGRTSGDMNASQEIWQFVRSWSR